MRGKYNKIGFEYTEGDISISDTVEIAERKMRENKREFYADNIIAVRQNCR